MRAWTPLFLLLCSLFAGTASATVPTQIEPDYAEAILAYHDRNYAEVLRLLGPFINQDTRSEELLEIAALTYKSLGQEKKSEKLYQQIISLLTNRNASAKELIPYEFELALFHYRAKKMEEAQRIFKRAVALEFNEVPARFFLGIIAIERRDWETAQTNFQRVSQSPNLELSLSSHLYLAQVYAGTNSQGRMVNEYVLAYTQARNEANNKQRSDEDRAIATKVLKLADKIVRPLKKHTLFGGVGLITSYDTNVFSDATTVVASGGSKKASLKETLQANLGYASPLLDEWQIVLSYRGSGNKNFNADTADAQFVQNEINLNLNHAPLEASSFGLKLSGMYLFQFRAASSGFEPYLAQGTAGPYWRFQFGNGWAFGGQANYYYRNQYQDSSLSETVHRSGGELEAKVSVAQNTHARLFNPMLELSVNKRDTKGTEYQSLSYGAELSNTSYVASSVQLLLALAYAKAAFNVRPDGPRADGTVTARAAVTVSLLKSLQWINDVQVISNTSNVELYAYTRNVISTGLSYSF